MAEEEKVVAQQEVKAEVKSTTKNDSPRGKRPFNKKYPQDLQH